MSTDLLYYIMDYSGNYYKINKENQLVVAASEKEADVLTFEQANRRVGVGKKSSFYFIIPVENISVEKDGMDTNQSSAKNLANKEIQEPIKKNVSSYDLSELDWSEYLTHFICLVSAINNYRDSLTKKLSDIDQKICDIMHYIELCETNANEANDLIELLRVCRENRREIKDELSKSEYFKNYFGTSDNVINAQKTLNSIKGLDSRKYKPRKYDELFENYALKDKHREKNDFNEVDAIHENKKINFCNEKLLGKAELSKIKTSEYSNRLFGMFEGKQETVTLLCENNAANVIIDRFGIDVPIIKTDENHFKVKVDVSVSKLFFGWIMAIPGVKIVAPESTVSMMKEEIKRLQYIYFTNYTSRN